VIDSTQLRKQVEVLIDSGMKTDSASQLLKPIKRAT
jgi:hypothetical protein